MAETRRKFDLDFKEGAVRLVRETGKPIAQVAKDLGINEGTLGNWVNADKRRRSDGNGTLSEDERAELARLRRENAELAMERDVLKRSVALWRLWRILQNRHTTALHLLQSGVELNVIKSWLGHVSITTTSEYIEIDMAMKRKAIERCAPPAPGPEDESRWHASKDIIQWLEDL